MKLLKRPTIRLMLVFLLGFSVSMLWSRYQHPIQPLYVDIYNGTSSSIPEVKIQHGKSDLQERIRTFRLKPGEHRILSLNHTPGPGFNIEAHLADGRILTICAGKSDAKLVRASITAQGIIPLPIR